MFDKEDGEPHNKLLEVQAALDTNKTSHTFNFTCLCWSLLVESVRPTSFAYGDFDGISVVFELLMKEK